ncbi:MAG: DUF6265 family protein [Pyrinomonadaceae bacterium]
MGSYTGVFIWIALGFVVMVPAQTATLESFAGLAGCWERNEKGSQDNEMWLKPAGMSMIGVGRSVKGGKTVDFEFLRIEQRPDGIYYVAKPKSNKEETAFKLRTAEGGTFVFENPEHDFPQRIIYKLNGTSFTARIEGTQNGKVMGIDFPKTRISCD